MVSREDEAPPTWLPPLAFHERDMWTGPDIWTPVERITEANGTVEGRKGREAGPVDVVVSTRWGTRDFNYSATISSNPGTLSTFRSWQERRDPPGWPGSAMSFLTSGEMGQRCITLGGFVSLVFRSFNFRARTWICSPPLRGSIWLIVDSCIGVCNLPSLIS